MACLAGGIFETNIDAKGRDLESFDTNRTNVEKRKNRTNEKKLLLLLLVTLRRANENDNTINTADSGE